MLLASSLLGKSLRDGSSSSQRSDITSPFVDCSMLFLDRAGGEPRKDPPPSAERISTEMIPNGDVRNGGAQSHRPYPPTLGTTPFAGKIKLPKGGHLAC